MFKKPEPITVFSFNISDFVKKAEAVSKQVLLVISVFWLCVASLEFLQDYISSVVNNSMLSVGDSLAYKTFWLLFIPSTFLMFKSLKSLPSAVFVRLQYLFSASLVIGFSLVHLLLFSLVLYGISNLIHSSPWDLHFLIAEKLSTRLYISVAVYAIFAILYYRSRNSETSESNRSSNATISIKNGKKTVILDTREIKWISSEGDCLFIHTTGKKHIASDSLKNIITKLPDYFYRIHRSTIVNINMVKELRSRLNGDYDVILRDDNMLRLSRNYSKPVKEILL